MHEKCFFYDDLNHKHFHSAQEKNSIFSSSKKKYIIKSNCYSAEKNTQEYAFLVNQRAEKKPTKHIHTNKIEVCKR